MPKVKRFSRRKKLRAKAPTPQKKSRVVHGTKPGPKPYLRPEEEKELVDHLTKLWDVDYRRPDKR